MTSSMFSRVCPVVAIVLLGGAVLATPPPVTVQLTPDPDPDAPWTDIPEFVVDVTSGRVVYQADPTGEDAYQVLSVPIAGGEAAEISHPEATGNIQTFKLTADGARVVYRANSRIHSTLIEGGGNVLLTPDHEPFSCWDLSADGLQVAFTSSSNDPWGSYLFKVPCDGSGSPTLIGPPYVPGDAGCPITVGPGEHVAYKYQYTGTMYGLRVINWDGQEFGDVTSDTTPWGRFSSDDGWFVINLGPNGLVSVNLQGGSGGGGGMGWPGGPTITPVPLDGSYHVLWSDPYVTDDLFSQPIAFDAPPVWLGNDVRDVTIGPDGQRTVFESGGNLISVPTLGGAAQQLNGPLPPGGQIEEFLITPDSGWVVYAATELDPDRIELFVVDIDGGAPARISALMPSWGDVEGFLVSADSASVVYRADIGEDSAFRLYAVPLHGGESLPIGGDIESEAPRTVRADMTITPDDRRVVYRTGFVSESGPPAEVLFSVELETDGDADGVFDSVDCDNEDAQVWALPGEVTDLRLAKQAGEPHVTLLEWSPPADPGGSAVQYDLLRTASATGFRSGGGVTCVLAGGPDPTAQDADLPEGVHFFLARAVNGCGLGTSGPGRPATMLFVCD